MSYRFEPHDHIPADRQTEQTGDRAVGGGGVPGVGVWLGGLGGVLYRYPARPIPGPVFNHILKVRPYPRPNEGLFRLFDEVSQIGSRIGPRIDQN